MFMIIENMFMIIVMFELPPNKYCVSIPNY